MKLFHDPSVNQFEKCFRLDCSRLIIQMHIHSDYFMPADYVISAAERELFMNACTTFVFPCLFSCRYLYIIVNICLFVAVCMRLHVCWYFHCCSFSSSFSFFLNIQIHKERAVLVKAAIKGLICSLFSQLWSMLELMASILHGRLFKHCV